MSGSKKPLNRDLSIDLGEQRYFLRASAEAYDAGNEIEAKRLAVTIRVLVHDTFYKDGSPNSRSLLGLMGIKECLRWITVGAVDPTNMVSSMNLTSMMMERREDATYFAYVPVRQVDLIERGKLVDFDTWWTESVIKDTAGEEFSRMELITALANKDGGAHVDDLQKRVAALANEGSLGWSVGAEPQYAPDVDGVAATDSTTELLTVTPLLASVRTIANEVLLTLRNQQEVIDRYLPPLSGA